MCNWFKSNILSLLALFWSPPTPDRNLASDSSSSLTVPVFSLVLSRFCIKLDSRALPLKQLPVVAETMPWEQLESKRNCWDLGSWNRCYSSVKKLRWATDLGCNYPNKYPPCKLIYQSVTFPGSVPLLKQSWHYATPPNKGKSQRLCT